MATQHKRTANWLPEDGILDEGAIEIAVGDERRNNPPKLTEREGRHAAQILFDRGAPQSEVIDRLRISERNAQRWSSEAKSGRLV